MWEDYNAGFEDFPKEVQTIIDQYKIAFPESRTRDLCGILRDALALGLWDIANSIISQDLVNIAIDPKDTDTPKKPTYLDIACYNAPIDLIKLLAEKGAKMQSFGSLALWNAKRGGNLEAIDFLLNELGVDVDLPEACGHGSTCLLVACANEEFESSVKFWVERGASVAASNYTGSTPLHAACARRHERQEVIQYLVEENGANVNAKDDHGLTPLHCAAGWGDLDTAEYFIRMKADVNSKDDKGETPLHHACRSCGILTHGADNFVEMVRCLIDSGSDVAAQDDLGQTPLHHALWARQMEIVKLLLDAGGAELLRIATFVDECEFPLDVVQSWGIDLVYSLAQTRPIIIHALPLRRLKNLFIIDPTIFKWITSSKTRNLPVHDACEYGVEEDVIEFMVEKYPTSLNKRNSLGRLPLHVACGTTDQPSYALISMLLRHNCLAATVFDFRGEIPLLIAASNDADLEIIHLLLWSFPTSVRELRYGLVMGSAACGDVVKVPASSSAHNQQLAGSKRKQSPSSDEL